MNKVLEKLKELQQLIQAEYGLIADVDVWIHRQSNPELTLERAVEIRSEIAGEEMGHCDYDVFRGAKSLDWNVEIYVGHPKEVEEEDAVPIT